MDRKYLLKTVDSTLSPSIPELELTLTESDIEKIEYLKYLAYKGDKKFGTPSGLRFSFDVTDSHLQKVNGSEYDVDITDSRLEYIGKNKFQIVVDLIDQYGDKSCIFAESFEIDDFQKDMKLEGDDSIENLKKTGECLDKHVNKIKKILNELEGLGSVERSLLKWKLLADIHEISESLKET